MFELLMFELLMFELLMFELLMFELMIVRTAVRTTRTVDPATDRTVNRRPRVEGRRTGRGAFVAGRDSTALAGTTALVTGASSGIGEATALALAERGAAVALVARRRDRLEDLAGRVEAAGGTALVLEADITSPASATDVVEQAVSRLGRLDLLVNNAGVMLLGPAEHAPVEEWQRMVELNVLGLMYCAHAALPHLLRAAADGPRQVADMVNISSVAGRVARSGSGVYNATKFGVGAFSESLRQEFTKRHVRISLVEPGAVETELAGHNRPEVLETLKGRFAGMERLQSEDIADAIVYVVTRPRHVAVNEVLIRPTEQEG
jgi:NADP-dependent 3-hydroxy acid dehydrogenase YdfG